jgi:hypothetical protein
MPIVEYPAGSPFPGVIGRTADESVMVSSRRMGA